MTHETLADPKPYVAPRSGLRQAKRAWVPAVVVALLGVIWPIGAFALSASIPVSRDSSAQIYLAGLAAGFVGIALLSVLTRHWWWPLFFVIGMAPLGFGGLVLHAFQGGC